MKNSTILKHFASGGNAELTDRLIDDDPNFDDPEWAEYGTIDNVPIVVFYRTDENDQKEVDDNGGDWGAVDWVARITSIEIDITGCDRQDVATGKINRVCKKYGVVNTLRKDLQNV